MRGSPEPMPEELLDELHLVGIDPNKVEEWTTVGDGYAVRLESVKDTVIISIVKKPFSE